MLYANEVREAEQQWQANGIQSVPAVIINQQYLMTGGQPPEVFEQALRKIAAEQGS
jgi:predicted DsbA family dithiol-disulfide isomerase